MDNSYAMIGKGIMETLAGKLTYGKCSKISILK